MGILLFEFLVHIFIITAKNLFVQVRDNSDSDRRSDFICRKSMIGNLNAVVADIKINTKQSNKKNKNTADDSYSSFFVL